MTKKNKDKKELHIFSLASFFNDLGSDMIYPIWPLFVTVFLGADVLFLGIIDGMGEALVSISGAFSGYLSDKIRKRKIFVWTGYLSSGLARVGYSLSPTWSYLIPFRALDRAGKIRGAPRDAMIAELSSREDRGANFGFLRAMDNFGAIVGITLSIFLLRYLGFRNLILLASIPSFISVLIIYTFIKEKKFETKKRDFSIKLFDKNFRYFVFVNALFALGTFSYSFFLLYVKDIGFSIYAVPIFYLIFTISSTIFSYPFGKLADKIGRKKILMVSYLSFALVCGSLIFTRSLLGVVIIFSIYGIYKSANEVSQKTLASEICPIDYRATSLGSFQLIIGLMAFPASFIAGLLWQLLGMNYPLYFSLSLSLISFVLINFITESKVC